jgi:hypothetical protein
METLNETKTVSIELTEPIPSTNPSELKLKEDEEETSSIEEPEIIIPERIPSKNPRDFKTMGEIDQFLESINIKRTKKKRATSI